MGGVREVGEEGEKRGRVCQGGGKREKKGKIMQHCAISHNRKSAKRGDPTTIVYGKREV